MCVCVCVCRHADGCVTTTHISWCHHVTTEVTSEVITRDLGGQLTRRGGVRRNHTRGRSSIVIGNMKYESENQFTLLLHVLADKEPNVYVHVLHTIIQFRVQFYYIYNIC